MKDFRPISLCNVVYKLISKSLVIRFKTILPHVISETQSAFLPNRLITDNILVAFELVHCLKHKTRGRKGFSALKLDMSKAFDRVEWSFIAAVMGKMGFSLRWVALIINCLQTTQLSFIVNGAISGNVKPQRGLRQGDPLSPYLFLICSEGLSRLLQYEESIGCLKGLAISRHSPSISHLLFADDSLLFCEADDRSCGAIKRVLDTYHKASGQQLNTDKSVMSFSPNTTEAAKHSFRNILGMPICDCHESYLGLPAYSERDKKNMFNHIKERIWKLLHAWTDKIFSVGGKEVLLKAVIQSIPTYAMSCFKLPVKFCREIESMMSNYWWGTTTDKKKIHWKQWKFLCHSKMEGGLGFRNFIHFNQAVLAKQAWRLFQNHNSLLFRVLKGRYFPRNDFLSAATGGASSLTWQGICWGRELLKKGIRKKVGNGFSISCANDPWIPGNLIFTPIFYSGIPNSVVADYITPDREWNFSKLSADFSSVDVGRILSLPLSNNASPDYWIWHGTGGEYEVKSCYFFACSSSADTYESVSNPNTAWWKSFWQLKLPPKVKIFSWKAIHNALPVAAELFKKKSLTSASCSLCLNAWESVGHALFSCKHARHVWKIAGFTFNNKAAVSMNIEDFLFQISESYTKSELETIFCTMWSIWSDRNNVIHGKSPQQPTVISAKAQNFLNNYKSTQQLSLPAGLSPPATPSISKAWSPPPPTCLKLNVDAAFDEACNKIGFGAIIRDSNGNITAGMSHPINGCCLPQEMEAKGLFYSLKWARQLNFKVDMVETDSLILANALRKSTSNRSSFQDLIFAVQTELSYLPTVCVNHVYRDGNQAAHGLAKQALVLDNVCTWLEDFPSNSIRLGGRSRDCLSLLTEVRKRFEELGGINDLPGSDAPHKTVHLVQRAPFNSNFLVLDGSFKDGKCGLAAVGFDRNSSTWISICKSSEGYSALYSELQAIYMALQWAIEQRWTSIFLFSDCLVVVNALNRQSVPDWKTAGVFFKILKLVKSFEYCNFAFANRDFISGVNDLASQTRLGNIMDYVCVGEGLPPVNPILLGVCSCLKPCHARQWNPNIPTWTKNNYHKIAPIEKLSGTITGNAAVFNVLSYGAKGDGRADDTKNHDPEADLYQDALIFSLIQKSSNYDDYEDDDHDLTAENSSDLLAEMGANGDVNGD
ncbi:uncharacterized protein LOC133032190 [Cannabis sativa]|uniref:uncharacterized protein LOC133032190 n=1 Tax=Cannabis sativa TaxID=3483 RepID=UPI0029CA3EFB|nr:uncharacterized protein LOC133032190 [Cannabis sativa]